MKRMDRLGVGQTGQTDRRGAWLCVRENRQDGQGIGGQTDAGGAGGPRGRGQAEGARRRPEREAAALFVELSAAVEL